MCFANQPKKGNIVAKIETVLLSDVDNNPHRHLKKYPYVETKVEALMRSFKDVGMWEGVIGRKAGNRIQIAFGHHRVEAARRMKMKEISMIVKNMDDALMLKMMGRENGEDYNADFSVMLETWEAAVEFLMHDRASKLEATEVARFLGWTRDSNVNGRVIKDQMSKTASACANASKLMDGGFLDRETLRAGEGETPLSVDTVRLVTQRMNNRMDQFEKVAKTSGLAREKLEAAKKGVGVGVARALTNVKKGRILAKDAVGYAEASLATHKAVMAVPELMATQLGNLAKNIGNILTKDTNADRLDELAKLLPAHYPHMKGNDKEMLERVQFELGQLSDRAARRQRSLNVKSNVTPLKAITKQEG